MFLETLSATKSKCSDNENIDRRLTKAMEMLRFGAQAKYVTNRHSKRFQFRNHVLFNPIPDAI